MNYVAQSDIEQYLDITLTGNGINLFNILQPTMQDTVDLYCNRTWNFTNPITEYFDAINQTGDTLVSQNTFFIQYPKISTTLADSNYPNAQGIISVTVGTSPVDMNYVFSYGTFVKLTAQFPTVALPNPLGMKMIQIVYNSDAAGALPNPVKQALIEWIARKIQTAQDSNKDTTQVHAGTIRAFFKEDQLGEMPDFVRFVLDKYRLTPLDHF